KVTVVPLRICENTMLRFEFLTEVIYSAANWSGSREHDATHVSGYTERCSISRTSEAHKDIWEYILLLSTGKLTIFM
ncbi:hypothetical protein KSS87_003141, partial [Heliosperma pusillum]